MNSLLATLNLSARARARAFSSALAALELERKLGEVGGKINRATGYEGIERLRLGVGEREKALLEVRELASAAKKVYGNAVALRAVSQREVNDLLSRKSSWSSPDVMRFTELVQQDHANERAEALAKEAMDKGEDAVEKGFSDLMQAILERYHEEQVWSDKIRSLSTYGSLAITSLNVFLFIVTILLVEPWKRRRLVEGVEERLRHSTNLSNEATVTSITTLQSLLNDAQGKLDRLLISAPLAYLDSTSSQHFDSPSMQPGNLSDEMSFAGGAVEGSELETSGSSDVAMEGDEVDTKGREWSLLGRTSLTKEREREILIGAGGAAVGLSLSLLFTRR